MRFRLRPSPLSRWGRQYLPAKHHSERLHDPCRNRHGDRRYDWTDADNGRDWRDACRHFLGGHSLPCHHLMALELVLVMRINTAIALSIVLLLGSCHSFALIPLGVEASSGARVVRLRVWVSDQGLMRDVPWGAQAVLAVVLYPVNAVAGLVRGVTAPFDKDYDIHYGAVGFVVGIAVPGFTLLPRVMRETWRLEVSDTDLDVLMCEPQVDIPKSLDILRQHPALCHERIVAIEIGGTRYEAEQ